MLKKILKICLFYSVYWLLWTLWKLSTIVGRIVWWSIRLVFCLVFLWRLPKRKVPKAGIPEADSVSLLAADSDENMQSEPAPEEPKAEAISHIGNVIPIEEDHNLRTFMIMDPEGEIYRINTAQSGTFYGPVWTKILACYETQATLRARLVKPCYNKRLKQTGFDVRIGNVRAFLPAAHALRRDDSASVNIRVAVTHIDPAARKVTVSAKAAYERIFNRKRNLVAGEEMECIYWDYTDNDIYVLLPEQYLGMTPRPSGDAMEIAKLMGTIGRCRIEAIKQEHHEAIVTLLEEEKHANVASVSI